MDRFSRKNRTDIKYNNETLTDVLDNNWKRMWRINDDELNYIAEHASDDEINYFLGDESSITYLKKGIEIVNRLLEQKYKNE